MPSPSRARRFAALVPWIGPLIGACGGLSLRVGAAADPLLGKALAAVFVPVMRQDGRLVPPAPGALGCSPVQGKWIAWPKSDRNGRFLVNVPVGCWGGLQAGVLMILIYDLSGSVSPEDWLVEVKALYGKPLDDSQPASFDDLPPSVQAEIDKQVAKFLAQDPALIESALIALDPAHCGAPDPGKGVTFAVGSCQYPAGFLDRELAERSYRRLQRCLDRRDQSVRPQCVLLLGDQVYVDATAGLFDPATRHDRYELPYERLLRMKPLQHVLRRIPAYTMLDDHEIEDNWEPVAGRDPLDDASLADGRRHYLEYQRMAGPDARGAEGDSLHPLWYEFEVNGFPFFMADTRTERGARSAKNFDRARIMSETQFSKLEQWLAKHNASDIPKFIASPASVLPRRLRATQCSPAAVLRSDAWDGYPASLDRLLAYIAQHRIANVFFLSGDEHFSFISTGELQQAGSTVAMVYSIHSSALYAPYPFANGIQENLACTDQFRAGGYSCNVSTRRAPAGDGFTLLRVSHKEGKWQVQCRFIRGQRAEQKRKWVDVN